MGEEPTGGGGAGGGVGETGATWLLRLPLLLVRPNGSCLQLPVA